MIQENELGFWPGQLVPFIFIWRAPGPWLVEREMGVVELGWLHFLP